ncbi:MAG TPA: hypothetical protein DCY72_01125 [Ruminococcaceae bacterium]|nr:hypothetical protein [Oscillospiraceae bacterium]
MKMNENTSPESVTQELFDEANTAPKRYDVYLSTDPGKVRSGNEDNYAVNTVYRRLKEPQKNLGGTSLKEPLVCAVFDGMGGESNGELASKLSAEVASLVYYELVKKSEVNIDEIVTRFVEKSNSAVIEMLAANHSKRGGSTFVMTVFYGGVVYSYSLGDSRIYLYREGNLYRISNDQTLAMKKVRANILTEEEALTSPDRHKLTSFLGFDVDGEGLLPQIYQPFVLNPGDKLLLCSDGLYDMCPDRQIAELLGNKPDEACLELVDTALEQGGEDNITCILIACSEQ